MLGRAASRFGTIGSMILKQKHIQFCLDGQGRRFNNQNDAMQMLVLEIHAYQATPSRPKAESAATTATGDVW